MTRTGVRARVRVTLEIPAVSHWSEDVSAAQVRKQAIDDVLHALQCGLVINGLTAGGVTHPRPATVIGTPEVTAVPVDLDMEPST